MPEGPSIVILKEAVQSFIGNTVISATGNTKIDLSNLKGQKVIDFKTWGKHFLICFKGFTIRIHLLMFGSYRINEAKEGVSPRLSLQFEKGVVNFYTCSIKIIEGNLDDVYDWSCDVMNPLWNANKAAKKLKNTSALVCDVLLDQNLFAGVGNIIKNEVLFRIKVNPKSNVANLPPKQLKALIKEAVDYSFEFLQWKKDFVLKKHWLAYTKEICPRDQRAFIKEHTGKTNRRSFYCNKCQKLY